MKARNRNMHIWKPQKVRRLRRMFGETQEEFAARLRVSTGCLREWEQGTTLASGIATLALELLQKQVKEELAMSS